ncbi:MAG: nucleotidyltransferase domain-containing protein, partial [Myxococcota bacterium]
MFIQQWQAELKQRMPALRQKRQQQVQQLKAMCRALCEQRDVHGEGTFVYEPVGSFAQGVDTPESDVDIFVLGPSTLSWSVFVSEIQEHLAKQTSISEIRCIEDAKIPLLSFVCEDLSFDLWYAQAPNAQTQVQISNLRTLFSKKTPLFKMTEALLPLHESWGEVSFPLLKGWAENLYIR